MSDRHLRLLRAVAKRRQRDAERQDGPAPVGGSGARGRELKRAARAKARLGAAEARRRPPGS